MATALLTAVRQAYAAGLCLLPVREDGSKIPALPTWLEYKTRRPTADEIRSWDFGDRHGLGVIAGPVSGHVECWDFDDLDTYVAFIEAAEVCGLAAIVDRIRSGYEDETPRGGRRWLVKYPETVTWKDATLAARPIEGGKLQTLIELPTFNILAPSDGPVHPSGRPYVHVSGSAEAIAAYTIEEREALLELARSFDERPKTAAHEPRSTNGTGKRPGDVFNQRMTWPEVIGEYFHSPRTLPNGVTYWWRPGKTPGDGSHAATTNHAGSDLLYVFSSSTKFETERSYTKFGAHTILEHAGDFSAAGRALWAAGFRDPDAESSTTNAAEPSDHQTELGAAERFTRLHGAEIRYDHRRDRWLLWEGHRWRPDADTAVARVAFAFAREWQREGFDLKSDARKEFFKFTFALERRSTLANMLYLARSLKPIADAGDQWDTDPWLLGTPSGVVDLQTGRIRPGRPRDRLTMQTRARFEPTAPCPRWERFLTEIFEGQDDLIAFIQRAVGYSLTGITTEQVLFMLYGTGANGKGTFANTLKHALGDYAWNMPFATVELYDRSAIPNDIAALVNRRFVIASETNDGARLNEARVKALTGCDPMTARFLHSEFFEFEPVAKFWLSVNHRPIVKDNSYGFWRRLRLIPFKKRFTLDPALAAELEAEASGILAWAVRGALAWQADGLTAPAVVVAATEAYEAESDPLRDFLDEACDLSKPEATAYADSLFKRYKAWADERGIAQTDKDRLSQTMFGRKLGERFGKDHDRKGWFYRGVGLGLWPLPDDS